jgi:hypothetical protein
LVVVSCIARQWDLQLIFRNSRLEIPSPQRVKTNISLCG